MASATNFADMVQAMASLGLTPEELMQATASGNLMSVMGDRKRPTFSTDSEEGLDEQIAQEIERVQANFQREKAMRPRLVMCPPRHMVFQSWETNLKQPQLGPGVIRMAYVGTDKHFSRAPLSQLTKSAFYFLRSAFVVAEDGVHSPFQGNVGSARSQGMSSIGQET
jgi:hypothetical protein